MVPLWRCRRAQRGELIDEIRKADLLLEYAVRHGEEFAL